MHMNFFWILAVNHQIQETLDPFKIYKSALEVDIIYDSLQMEFVALFLSRNGELCDVLAFHSKPGTRGFWAGFICA